MARLVRREATDPIKILPPPGTPPELAKTLFICACGVSQKFPFCDGSHKGCRGNEVPGKLYVYSPDNTTVVEVRDDPHPPTTPHAAPQAPMQWPVPTPTASPKPPTP